MFTVIESNGRTTVTGKFPTTVSKVENQTITIKANTTAYIFVLAGNALVESSSLSLPLHFSISVPGPDTVYINGSAMVVVSEHQHGMFTASQLETYGRLKYIDGCHDSLLIPPTRFGEPCLNALYFPPGIEQTAHTHPSLRAGCVVSGEGRCITEQGITPLVPGTVFLLSEDTKHHFVTLDQAMVVVAYHPDSDFGPKDEDHPMVNRTFVNGIAANAIAEIRTN